jgi:uncharacterized membrane protein YfcA
MPDLDLVSILAIFAALALGGTVKGATGAGAPVIAVPVIAAFYDVRLGVMIMAMPNLLSNSWQLWRYRAHLIPGAFTWMLAAGAAAGCVAGTFLLAVLPDRVLLLAVASGVAIYIALRLARPEFRLSLEAARRIVWPISLGAGMLQGAAGISAPITLSYLNAMRLARPVFIATVSAIFIAMAAVQVPALFVTGLLSVPVLALSIAALAPILLFMPLGAWLARKMSAEAFDKLVLGLLAVLALRLFYSALVG